MRKLKKGVKVCLFFLFFLLFCVISYFGYQYYLKEKEFKQVEEIRLHYASSVMVRNDAKIYQSLDSSYPIIGNLAKDYSFDLEEIEISKSNQTYFKIKDSSYYVFYEDVTPIDKSERKTIPDYYVPLSKEISTLGDMNFFQDGEEVLTILQPLTLSVLYADEIFYYVSYFEDIFGVKKDEVEASEKEPLEEEASFVSVISFAEEKSDCKSNSCITVEKEKEFLKVLSDQKKYTISEMEYISWLNGTLRLKPGAIYIEQKDSSEQRVSLFEEYGFFIGNSEQLKFVDNNQATKKDTKMDSVNRYVIHQNTIEEHMKKIMNGETIVIENPKSTTVIKGLPDINAKATHIAVLNYHFFYNSEAQEVCNEGNCLDVKNFREQLEYLKKNQYKTLTMEEYRAWIYGEIELPARSVLLTIDDGAMGTGKHNGNKLIPLLEEYQMHATLFLISGWWSVDNYQSEYLDIESHTYDMHQERVCSNQPRGAKMLCSSKEEVLQDLRLSIERTGSSTAFCFPFYAYNDLAIQSLKEVGFKLAFIGGSYKSSRGNDKYKIPRYPIHKTTSLEQFMNMIH